MTIDEIPGSINFHAVIQSGSEPLVIISGTGTVKFGNTAFCTMFETSPDNIVEKSLYSIQNGIFDHAVIRENLYFLFADNEQSVSFFLPSEGLIFQGKKIRVKAGVLEKHQRGTVEQILIRFEDITDKNLADIAIRQKTLEILERTTPITKIWEQILIVPMIGAIDSNRANKLIEQLLTAIRKENAHYIIIDGYGVSKINAQVASHIINAISAINLLGAHVILTGLKPDLAMMMVENGVDLQNVTSKISLQEGIQHALSSLGYSISRNHIRKEEHHPLSHGGNGIRSSLRVIHPMFNKL